MPQPLVALLAVLVLALAACGGEDGDGAADTAPAETAPAESPARADTAETAPPAGGDAGSKPEVEVPEGKPPKKLVVEDLEEGDGKAAKAGDTVSVHYVGVSHSSGEEFDSSWGRGTPFEFQLGAGAVIPGWDQGVEGMRVGGRRQLVIPPDLAYGEQGAGGVIGPNETLVFVIDLLDVR